MKEDDYRGLYGIYLLVISYLWYSNLVLFSTRQSEIYTITTTLALIFFFVDWFLAIVKKEKILRVDFPDQIPKDLGGKKFWSKGLGFDLILGVILALYFTNTTAQYGTQWAGLPSIVPNQLSQLPNEILSALVAVPENALSALLSFTSMSIIMFIYSIKYKKESKYIKYIAIGISCYISAYLMMSLHMNVYQLNELALGSVLKFFFIINLITAWRGTNYSGDILHGLWNYNVVRMGMHLG